LYYSTQRRGDAEEYELISRAPFSASLRLRAGPFDPGAGAKKAANAAGSGWSRFSGICIAPASWSSNRRQV